MAENFVILRAEKITTIGNLSASGSHAWRERETPNAITSRTPQNVNLRDVASTTQLLDAVSDRVAQADQKAEKPVLCIAYLVTASPEAMHAKTREQRDAYFADSLKYLEGKHGKENVVAACVHRDETTDHMTVWAVPLVSTNDRIRKRSVIVGTNPDGTKRRETREFAEKGAVKLSAAEFLDGPAKLSRLQTDFAEKVGKPHGLERGQLGSRARHTTIQQYYGRVNEAFDPLPEVVTPPQTIRAEPEKPGLFAGKEAKQQYEADLAQWQRDYARGKILHDQRQAELKAQTAAAVESAQRNQAQAKEATALKAQVTQLKRSNSHYVKKSAELEVKLGKLYEVAQLFTPEEVKTRMAEKQRQATLARQQAAEAAKLEAIESEQRRRIEALPKLEKAHGAEYTYGRLAAKAIKDAGDAGKVDWRAVDRAVMREAIAEHGQTPESVTKAILARSPALADASKHQLVVDGIKRAAPDLQDEYAQAKIAKRARNGPSLG